MNTYSYIQLNYVKICEIQKIFILVLNIKKKSVKVLMQGNEQTSIQRSDILA